MFSLASILILVPTILATLLGFLVWLDSEFPDLYYTIGEITIDIVWFPIDLAKIVTIAISTYRREIAIVTITVIITVVTYPLAFIYTLLVFPCLNTVKTVEYILDRMERPRPRPRPQPEGLAATIAASPIPRTGR